MSNRSSGPDRWFLRLIGAEWDRIGSGLRRLCVALLLLGVVFLALGAVADLLGLWSDYPFLTNVASGITTASFGIPAAVLVLGALTSRQQKRLTAMQNSALVADSLRDLRRALLPILQLDAEEYARSLGRIIRSGDTAITVADNLRREDLGVTKREAEFSRLAREDARATLEIAFDELSDGLAYTREHLPGVLDLRDMWGSATSQWRLIQSQVRIRAKDADIPWLPVECTAVLDGLLNRQECFLLPVIEIIDSAAKPTFYSIQSILDSPRRPTPSDVFRQPFVRRDIASTEFETLVDSTVSDLGELRFAVDRVSDFYQSITGHAIDG